MNTFESKWSGDAHKQSSTIGISEVNKKEAISAESPEASKKTLAEMRAENITKKLRGFFQSESEFFEANRIALKINAIIDALPEEQQKNALEKLRTFLGSENAKKDIYYYKELNDEIVKERNKMKQIVEKNKVEANINDTISFQTVYIDGKLRDIQSQRSDQPEKVKVNLGRGWELMNKDAFNKILQESDALSEALGEKKPK